MRLALGVPVAVGLNEGEGATEAVCVAVGGEGVGLLVAAIEAVKLVREGL